MEVIVPAAGLSTRFPNMRPKYLLYGYNSKPMIASALEQYYLQAHKITIGILQEHEDKYNASQHIFNALPSNGLINVVILKEPTKGPADTVYQILETLPKSFDYEVLIKDCDSFFGHDNPRGNYICCSHISKHEVLKKLYSKSFIQYNENGLVTNIVEKQVVSDTFCVGGYKFESAQAFRKSFEKLNATQSGNEIFVSHIIKDMIQDGHIFSKKEVENYVDVGTAEDWHEYNDRPTIFCDIDGTLIKAQSRFGHYNYESEPIVLEENVKKIKEYEAKDCELIFVTSRPTKDDIHTLQLLQKLGFKKFRLVSGLNNTARVLINDYTTHAPFPRAVAINIHRDRDNLKEFI